MSSHYLSHCFDELPYQQSKGRVYIAHGWNGVVQVLEVSVAPCEAAGWLVRSGSRALDAAAQLPSP